MTLPKQVTIHKIKKMAIPNKFIFFDCETKPNTIPGGYILHRLWFGCGLFWERGINTGKDIIQEMQFTNNNYFWSWVDKQMYQGETLYLFAHNVKFDFLVSDGFSCLPSFGYTMRGIYHKFTTTIMKFQQGNKRIIICDTMNYYPVSLDKLAVTVGEKKVKVNFDNPNERTLQERCKVDVRIIYKAVKLIIDRLIADDLGGFKPTSPSISFNIFRYKFMRHTIITHHRKELVDLEQKAYYGGYVNIFKLFGKGSPNLYKLDINAMYPSIMMNNNYPVVMVDFLRHVSVAKLEKLVRKYLVTARVIIQTNKPVYPYRFAKGVCYPLGTFETVLTTPSILRALRDGAILEVLEVITYQGRDIFTDYVTFMYNARMDAKHNKDIGSELFYKTMMNSLYGKFGQTSTESTVIGSCDLDEFTSFTAMDARTGESWKELHAGGSVIKIVDGDESRYTFFPVAAHVTDYARNKLFDLIDLAGRDNVYYSDTDSIITNEQGFRKVRKQVHDTMLGYLKVEELGQLFIGFAKKDYLFGSSRKIKGFAKESIPGKPHSFLSQQSVSFYGAMRASIKAGAYWKVLEKLHAPYVRDCLIGKDGKVIPLHLPEQDYLLGEKIYTLEKLRSLSSMQLHPLVMRILSRWL